eukprot:GHVH01011663.1.p1 GENE.GHVH01011663.1~~GHVH01011663.1.p1  ORF type:complete len:370 (+),score=55.86 GHVH01011663.1:91-1200(+)
MIKIFLITLASFFSLAGAASEVVELNVSNFKDTVLGLEKGEGLFVKFYAPWCGHCKKLAPTWENLALEQSNTRNTIAHIDSSDEKNRLIGQYFGVKGFPTLILFRDGKQFKYAGKRDLQEMSNWLKEEAYLAPESLSMATNVDESTFVLTTTTTTTISIDIQMPVISLTDENFEHETQSATGATTGAWFVKFYTPWCGHCKKLAPVWQELANKQKTDIPTGLNVAEVDLQKNPDLQTRFGIKSYPTLLMFKDGMMYRFSGKRQVDDLQEWVTSKAYLTSGDAKPVPPVLTMMSRVHYHVNEAVVNALKLYKAIFSMESLKVMYNNQPLLVIGAGSIIACTTLLIAYQLFSIMMGFMTGVPKSEEKGKRD